MKAIVINTQYLENYSFDDNGYAMTGQDAFWKAKGGYQHIITRVPDDIKVTNSSIEQLAMDFHITYADNYSMEYIIDWSVEDFDNIELEQGAEFHSWDETDVDYDDSMDGDHASALASAGWGTDEDY